MRLGMTCWVCAARCTGDKIVRLTPTMLEVGYRCSRLECGMTFVGRLEAVRVLSPSALPTPPGINVPLSHHIQRRMLAQQIEAMGSTPDGPLRPLPPVTLDLFSHAP